MNKKPIKRETALTLAAAVAALGTALGVAPSDLVAGEPTAGPQKTLPAIQEKEKLSAKQQKGKTEFTGGVKQDKWQPAQSQIKGDSHIGPGLKQDKIRIGQNIGPNANQIKQ